MNETLKRCPFCGGEAIVETDTIGKGQKLYYVSCKDDCVHQHGYYRTEELAIEAWNRRAPLDHIIERLEEEEGRVERNSEKAEALGEAYERHYVFFGAKAAAYRKAIEIIKEEVG